MVPRETHQHPVIDHDALFVQHQAIARRPGASVEYIVYVHAIEKLARIGPAHFDLSQRRVIHESDAATYRPHLAGNRLGFALAIARIADRPPPARKILEYGA